MGRLPPGITYKKLGIIAAIVVAALVVSRIASESLVIQEVVETYGYFGVLISSVVSSLNPIVPIPVVAFVPVFLSAGLEFWPVTLAIALGVTLGDTIGYFIGRAGFAVLSGHMEEYMVKIKEWRKKYPKAPLGVLFAYTLVVPAPNELIVIPLALAGYRLAHILPILLVGNFIFNTVLASGLVTVFDRFL